MTQKEILAEIAAERARQDKKWGEQNHPDGTGQAHHKMAADMARWECDTAFKNGKVTWHHILNEEYLEAVAESDEDKLMTELIQTAAVVVAWIEAIERRRAFSKKMDPEGYGE